MSTPTTVSDFWALAARSFSTARFIKLTLGKSRNRDTPKLLNLYARPIRLKDKDLVQVTYRFADHDEVKNHEPSEAFAALAEELGADFLSADLFTLDEQLSVQVSRKGKARLQKSPPRHREAAMVEHNRPKERFIDEDRPYLRELGIADEKGITPSGQKKYKQINKFIEVMDGLLRQHPPATGAHIVDMGSGKGYLTFALYDHLRNGMGIELTVTGVELRPDLVKKCNGIARRSGFAGLSFVEGYIDSYTPERIDVLIALHACDTATDDALIQGIRAEADLLVVAPCCQKQVRRSMQPPADMDAMLRHGILLERQAAMLTDALRSLYLESAGYTTKVFEFISLEHTAKNVMITAAKGSPRPEALREAVELKKTFGITRHRLEELLAEG